MAIGDRFDAILRMAKEGDETAWSVLYKDLAPPVLGFCRARGAPEPEDLVGEVFVQVARQIGTFEGDERHFRAWVFTIARGRLIDSRRRRARRPLEHVESQRLEELGPQGDVEAEAVSRLTTDEMLRLLDELTDDQRDVILLRVLGGFTAPEVARMLGRTTGSIEALQRRALRMLRRNLD